MTSHRSFALALGLAAVLAPRLGAAEDTDSPNAREREDELAELERAREILQELKELNAVGEIADDEFRRRVQQIRALYLDEGELPDTTCGAVTCSFHGICFVNEGEPACFCDDGYERAPDGGADCVPSKGWAKQAAIAGLIAAPLVAMTGPVASGLLAAHRSWQLEINETSDNEALVLEISGLTLVAVMGPVVALGGLSARRATGASGSVPALVTGGVLWAGSMFMFAVSMADIDVDTNKGRALWLPPVAAGLGGLSLLFLSIDALAAHEDAIESERGPLAPPEKPRRVFTWIAFGLGGGAAIAAGITGGRALKLHRQLDEREGFDDLCAGQAVGTEQVSCTGHNDQFEIMKLAAATDILIGAAATGVVMGTALFFLEPRLYSSDTSQTVALAPWAVSSGAGLALGGSF